MISYSLGMSLRAVSRPTSGPAVMNREVHPASRGVSQCQEDDTQPEFVGQRCFLSCYVNKSGSRGDQGFHSCFLRTDWSTGKEKLKVLPSVPRLLAQI